MFEDYDENYIEHILSQDKTYKLQQELQVVEESYINHAMRQPVEHNNFTFKQRPRKTHCWSCKNPSMNNIEHEVCSKCGWIKCPSCGRCSPSCR